MTTRAELATALAYVLQKWKDKDAKPEETKPFDDLLAGLTNEPQEELVKLGAEGIAGRRPRRDLAEKLAILDREIEAANREAE